jgi:glutathione S-transferase
LVDRGAIGLVTTHDLALAEIAELTGQRRVPVLVDGDEVIHDSKRIVEYLEHAYGQNGGQGR